jgi:hypothetical protein
MMHVLMPGGIEGLVCKAGFLILCYLSKKNIDP